MSSKNKLHGIVRTCTGYSDTVFIDMVLSLAEVVTRNTQIVSDKDTQSSALYANRALLEEHYSQPLTTGVPVFEKLYKQACELSDDGLKTVAEWRAFFAMQLGILNNGPCYLADCEVNRAVASLSVTLGDILASKKHPQKTSVV